MRIVSKFRDFYDGVQRYGGDDGLIYVRDQADGEKPISLPDDISNFIRRVSYEEKVITHKGFDYRLKSDDLGLVFCGTYYPKVRCVVQVHEYVKALGSTRTHVLAETYGKTRLEAEDAARSKLSLPEPPPPRYYTFGYDWRTGQFEKFGELLARTQQIDWLSIHQEYGAPVLAFEHKETYTGKGWKRATIVKRNPSLVESGFPNEKNAVDTYQEIAMYLGGVMISHGREMYELSNDEKIAKRGFDEWSFRRPPSKHK